MLQKVFFYSLHLTQECTQSEALGSIFTSVINQLDAQKFCFTISLFHVEARNKLIIKQKFVHQVG